MNNEAEPQRSRLRFSLRAILILFSLVALLMAGFGRRLHHAHTQKRAIEEVSGLEAITGFVYDWQANGKGTDARGRVIEPPRPTWALKYFGEDFFFHVVELDICQGNVADDQLAPISKFPKLQSLNLLDLNLQGQGLQHVSHCTDLTALLISDCPFTDSGLKHIRNLTNLEHLRLCITDVSDDGMQHIEHLKNLRHLDLAYTKVGDDGLRHLAELIQLKSLVLAGTSVSDTGLPHLYGLKNLETLSLPQKADVSEAAIRNLKSKLPKCSVILAPATQ